MPYNNCVGVSAIDRNNIGKTISTNSLTVGNNITGMPKGMH